MDAPVLLIIFNRPDTTQKVFEAVRLIKPSKLLIAADAPRPHRPDEFIKCQQARDITENIDWDCEVHRQYSETNLGCKYGPISAINWAFSIVDEAIILEDDCLPSTAFFHFCNYFLHKYRHDHRVMQIAGTNLLDQWKSDRQDYHFSYSGCIWGWATWKRAWHHYDPDMKLLNHPEVQDRLKDVLTGQYEFSRRMLHWKTAIDNKIDAWDYQWDFARFVQSGLCVVPSRNLVINLGFGHPDATHTAKARKGLENQRVYDLSFPLKENPYLIVDRDYDRAILPVILPKPNRLLNGIKKLLKAVLNFLPSGQYQEVT